MDRKNKIKSPRITGFSQYNGDSETLDKCDGETKCLSAEGERGHTEIVELRII